MIVFHAPYALALLALLPWILLARDGGTLIRSDAAVRGVRLASPIRLGSLASGGRVAERAVVLNVLRVLAYVFLVIALARPQTETSYSETESSGRDIMLALDTSGSMNALDFFIDGQRVDRLMALKHVVKDFIEARKGDRMGLVVFGSEVFTQCPLTLDRRILNNFVSTLEIGMAGDGTALGDALVVAVKRLREIPAKSKVVVLVTDGVKTAGSVEPKAAAEIAQKEGIKVYTIGIGGDKPAPFRVTDIFGRPRIEYRPVELDANTLREIAESTGGKYYNAEKTEALAGVYEKISQIEERVEKTFEYHDYEEHFFPFLLFGLTAFLLHELLAATRYLIVPEK